MKKSWGIFLDLMSDWSFFTDCLFEFFARSADGRDARQCFDSCRRDRSGFFARV